MKTMRYQFMLLMLLVVAIVILALWTTPFSLQHHALAPASVSHLPDAYMEEVQTMIMDKTGAPKMKIETPHMIHYLEHDTTKLMSPHVTIYKNSPEPWHVTARFALATEGTKNILFWDNVLIHHVGDIDNPTTSIKTSTLTIHPEQRSAETDALITLHQPNLRVKAKGMYADMNSGDIKLLSQTRGEYDPSTS